MIRRGAQRVLIVLTLVFAATAAARGLRAAGSSCQFNGVERIVAVGDVHGAYERFVEILKTTGVIDERLRWVGGHTHLVQVGDVVDRGPDSLKALDLLQKLQKDAGKAGGAVHPLLGNHEVMRMLGDLRFTTPGEFSAFVTSKSKELKESYLERLRDAKQTVPADMPLGQLEMRIAFGQNGDYGKWLRSLDAVIQINGIVFAHGGISPATAGLSCSSINETVHKDLTTELDQLRADPLSRLTTRADGPLWYRGLAEEGESFAPAVDDILMKQSARAIVVAHTVSGDGRVRVRFGGKVVQIDTGMQQAYVPNGRASALVVERGAMTAVYTDRRDALPPQ